MTVASFLSPIGWICIQSENEKLVSVLFSNEKPIETPQQDSIVFKAVNQLKEYFENRRTHFDLPLNLQGTSFQKKVWKQLALIPWGETRSYHEISQSMGLPKVSRAVGHANSKNPFVIIIPCHRVIHADGTIGGYNGGTERKKWLLDHESSLKVKCL